MAFGGWLRSFKRHCCAQLAILYEMHFSESPLSPFWPVKRDPLCLALYVLYVDVGFFVFFFFLGAYFFLS